MTLKRSSSKNFAGIWTIRQTSTLGVITPALPFTISSKLSRLLSYRPAGYAFSPKFQNGYWDGYLRLFNRRRQSFPAGFTQTVTTFLRSRQMKVKVKKSKLLTGNYQEGIQAIIRTGKTPRPYQKKGLKIVLSNPFGRGIIALPPRLGKTNLMGMVFAAYNRPGLFIVESLDIAHQTIEVLDSMLGIPNVGLIGDGEVRPSFFTVATIQSLCSAYNQKYETTGLVYREKEIFLKDKVRQTVETVEVVCVDEVHHAAASTYRFILNHLAGAGVVLGLSATPFRTDSSDILLEAGVGPIILKRSYKYAISKGYLLPVQVIFYSLPKSDETGAYPALYKKYVTDNTLRNNIITRAAHALTSRHKSVVAAIGKIKHGENLKYEYGKGATLLVGKEDSTRRRLVKKALEKKLQPYVISTLFSEGVDIPSLDCLINCEGGKSAIAVFQRLRPLTPFPGKKKGILIDFLDNVKYLREHSRARLRLYKKAFGKIPTCTVEIRNVS